MDLEVIWQLQHGCGPINLGAVFDSAIYVLSGAAPKCNKSDSLKIGVLIYGEIVVSRVEVVQGNGVDLLAPIFF
ncbi:MAG: hypothetical protein GXP21_07075 [Gammaproteobacteria bacterium]|nr:hypothetical protein [Gammaproteobacteria bacterium]